MPPEAPTSRLPETVRRIGRVHHVALIVRSIEESLGLWRDALSLELETVMDIPSDHVRIAFLGVGESKIELVEPTDDVDRRRPLPGEQGRGLPPRLLRGPEPRRDTAAPRDRRHRTDRHGPAQGRRGAGRLPPPALVPRCAGRADRGARRAGLGVARLLSVSRASSPAARTSGAARRPCRAAAPSGRCRRRRGSRPSSRGTGAR